MPGPLSPFFTLSSTKTRGVVMPVTPTANCVLPTPPLKTSLSVNGRTVMVVFNVPEHPRLSVTVTTTGPRSTVFVGVPDTTPVLVAMVNPEGRPVALHVKLEPELPVWLKSTPAYTAW